MVTKNIDFVIVNHESFDMARLLIKSIHKYSAPYNYHVYLVDNSTQKHLFENEFQESFTYLKGDNNVNQKGFPSQISSAHSHALQKGVEAGNGDYVCLLDVDTCFLDTWTDDVLPMLTDNLFVSHRWEPGRQIARPMFMIFERIKYDQYNIDFSIAYQDSGGIFTKTANENGLQFKILINSYNDKQLQAYHAIDPGRKIIKSGEQAFIQKDDEQLKAFFWHFGRGTTVGIVDEWYELLENYLES